MDDSLAGHAKRPAIFLEGDGAQSKSYLHVDGCVDAMLTGADRSRDRVSIYNAGSEDRISVLDIARIVIEEMGLRNTRMRLVGGRMGGMGQGRQGHAAGLLEDRGARLGIQAGIGGRGQEGDEGVAGLNKGGWPVESRILDHPGNVRG